MFKIALLGGLVLVVYQLILYLGGVDWMLKWPLALMHYVIIIAVITFIVMRTKSLNANKITLSKAFKSAFFAGFVLTFFAAVYSFALFTFDSDIREELKESNKMNYVEMMRERDVAEENINRVVEQRDLQFAQRSVFVDSLYQWISDLVIIAVLSVVIALVIKTPVKSQP